MPRAALCSPRPIGQGPRIRARSHKQQHKHTQPLDVIPHREVSLPKLFFFVDQLANHRASVDRSPRGASNPADVASAGQQQTLPGGTNAQRSTGTARRAWLFSPQTHKRPSICTASPFFAEFQLSIRWRKCEFFSDSIARGPYRILISRGCVWKGKITYILGDVRCCDTVQVKSL